MTVENLPIPEPKKHLESSIHYTRIKDSGLFKILKSR